MCGVLGVVGPELGELEAAVARSLAALRHRGPDALRVVPLTSSRAACVLAVARLRIIDLSPDADQPMSNEDASVWVAYNGEIYNFGELRVDLERAGHRFRSRTDTEVLVHLYEDVAGDAASMLRRLRGMFAFAIYDVRRGRLLLARDRLGIKPMYVSDLGTRGLVFGSEARSLVASGLVPSQFDPAGLAGYLAWGVIPGPVTVFAAVRELPPGHYLEWESGATRVEDWWSPLPDADADLADPLEAVRVMKAVLEDSVARHLIADRPIGVFLSGGLDSGVVATLAARTAERVRALTVTFPDIRGPDEGTAAAALARDIGAEHHEVPFTGGDMTRLLPDALGATDQPTWDAVNTWIVCRAARTEGLVVCLSGLGGDEVFGGYPSFRLVPRLARVRSALSMIPAAVRRTGALALSRYAPGGRLVRALDSSPGLGGAYRAMRGLFSPGEVQTLLASHSTQILDQDQRSRHKCENGGALGVGFLEMTRYLANQLLRDTDTVSMAHSLEVRVPLIDDVVVRLALSLPPAVRFLPKKGLLARAVGLDASVAKRPFALPFQTWLAGPLRETVREGVLSETLPLANVLSSAIRQRLWTAFEAGRVSWARPWAVAALRWWPVHNGLGW